MKVKGFIKNNIKVLVAFILGVIASGIGVYAVTVASSSVSYSNTSSGASATTVKAALDELYTIANRRTTLDGIDKLGLSKNSANTIFANSNGLCLTRKGQTSCFKTNDYGNEESHLEQVFSDTTCYRLYTYTAYIECEASDYYCEMDSASYVRCKDKSNNSSCQVSSSGTVTCT